MNYIGSSNFTFYERQFESDLRKLKSDLNSEISTIKQNLEETKTKLNTTQNKLTTVGFNGYRAHFAFCLQRN